MVVQDVIFMMHNLRQVVTPSDLAQYTLENADETPITYHQRILLTKEQLPIVRSQTKRLIFQSDYGTGKTVLLRAQAQMLAIPRKGKVDTSKIPKNICFVIFLEEQSLLVRNTQEFASLFLNIDVLFMQSAGIFNLITAIRIIKRLSA